LIDIYLPSASATIITFAKEVAGDHRHYYAVDFLFDGETHLAEATFVNSTEILIGTHLLQRHRLEINLATQTVLIEKVP